MFPLITIVQEPRLLIEVPKNASLPGSIYFIVLRGYSRNLIWAALAPQHTSKVSVPFSWGVWERAGSTPNGVQGEDPENFLR